MAGDFNKPTGSSPRAAFMQEIRDLAADIAKMLYSGTANIPDGCIRYNASTKMFEKYTAAGGTWAALDMSGTNAGSVLTKVPAAASGLATLDASSKAVQEPASKAAANGIASLNASSKVVQDPASKGVANGIASLDANSRLVEAANKISDGTNNIKGKVFNIGDWNMDTTAQVNIAHGIADYKKIAHVSARIFWDSGAGAISEDFGVASGGTVVSGTIFIGGTNITLTRVAGGWFDSTTFDSTSYNRGLITMIYVE